jgi:hypothetical protein
MVHLKKVDVVLGSGKVARRGVGGRGARQSAAEEMVSELGCDRAGDMLTMVAAALSDRIGVLPKSSLERVLNKSLQVSFKELLVLR